MNQRCTSSLASPTKRHSTATTSAISSAKRWLQSSHPGPPTVRESAVMLLNTSPLRGFSSSVNERPSMQDCQRGGRMSSHHGAIQSNEIGTKVETLLNRRLKAPSAIENCAWRQGLRPDLPRRHARMENRGEPSRMATCLTLQLQDRLLDNQALKHKLADSTVNSAK
jgi:hypothetical protein